MSDEWQLARAALTDRGVAGADDLGRFVSNTEYLRPSTLDERAAMPVLIELLPHLTDPKLIGAVAGHLRRPWARPQAYPALLDAFERWSAVDQTTAWHLGDALASAATSNDVPTLLRLVTNTEFGSARQMIVDSLWRFRPAPDVVTTLVALCVDQDVALHAMSALRRAVGPAEALPTLRRVQSEHTTDPLGSTAARQIRKAEASLRKSGA